MKRVSIPTLEVGDLVSHLDFPLNVKVLSVVSVDVIAYTMLSIELVLFYMSHIFYV